METQLHSQTENFRELLQRELLKRCKSNPQYSLRAFAKMLNVSPSALSAMLNGKRPISEKSKEQFGLALGLKLKEIENFKGKSSKSISYSQLTLDAFAVISDWYHYAILELLTLNDFKSDASWVSKRLGITKSEVNFAIERLERLGLIEITKDGEWKDSTDGFTTNIEEGLTSAAAKKFQEDVLLKAIEALKTVPLEKRDHTSMTMAINTKDIPEAKKMLKEFRRSFNAKFESSKDGKKDEVYNLSLAFYPITKERGE